MPHRLKSRQEKIQEKRKQTPWREFVMEIASWKPLVYYRNKGQTSRFPVSNRINTVPTKDFEQIREDALSYGQDFNASISFGEQLQNFWIHFPNQTLFNMGQTENADFADVVHNVKNVYLSSTVTTGCENVLYTLSAKEQSKNILNSLMVTANSENVYFGAGIVQGFNVFYSKYIYNSSNIWFSTNLVGCKECIFCDNLENQAYCINNIPLEKEIYEEEKKKILKDKANFLIFYKKISLIKGSNFGSSNCLGNFNINSNDIANGHLSFNVNTGNNVLMVSGNDQIQNVYDMFLGGALGTVDVYGVHGGGAMNNIYNSIEVPFSSFIYYSYYLSNCSYCLGCIGLKNKSYCIFNKQYTKEERYDKVDEIFTQMEKDGTLGQFFPATMNPFYFNDTAAYLIDPSFTKEEVTAKGYLWRDEPIRVDIPEGAKVVKTTELDQYEGFDDAGNRKIDPEVLKVIIQDEEGNVYRIVKMEYDFLMKHGLPLPRKHWLERMKENFRIQ